MIPQIQHMGKDAADTMNGKLYRSKYMGKDAADTTHGKLYRRYSTCGKMLQIQHM